MNEHIAQNAEAFIKELFEKKIQDNLPYHDIIHTEYVVGCARLIARNSGLSDEEINLVAVAAWFHDS